MANFNEEVEKLCMSYENAKDKLLRLTISEGQHDLQNSIFEDLKKMRDIGIESLKASNVYVPQPQKVDSHE